MVSLEDAIEAKANGNKVLNAAIICKEVVSHIAELRVSSGWSAEAETPAFNDKAATVYINILPKISDELFSETALKPVPRIRLVHPLSLQRSLCFVSEENESDEKQAENLEEFRRLGVLGKIKMIKLSLLMLAIKNDDREALSELVDLYDTHVLSRKAHALARVPVGRYFEAKNKRWVISELKIVASRLSETTMDVNSTLFSGVLTAVGHFGLTDAELGENILAVLDFVDSKLPKVFPDGVDSISAVQLKTGASEAVSAYEIVDPEEQIAKDVARPKRPEDPAFTDESATVYINLETAKVKTQSPWPALKMILPHPLSLNRRICCITCETSSKKKERNAEELQALGVTGKVKMIPESRLLAAAEMDARDSFVELAKKYDTYFVFIKCLPLAEALAAEKKTSIFMIKKDFMRGLCKTALWKNSTNDGYSVAVGHTGLTGPQLRANVAAATEAITANRDKLAAIKSIQLRTGTGASVAILSDVTVVEAKRSQVAALAGSQQVKKAKKAKKRKNLAVEEQASSVPERKAKSAKKRVAK